MTQFTVLKLNLRRRGISLRRKKFKNFKKKELLINNVLLKLVLCTENPLRVSFVWESGDIYRQSPVKLPDIKTLK